MPTGKNTYCVIVVVTLFVLTLATSACGKTASMIEPTQTPPGETADQSEPAVIPTDESEKTSESESTAASEPQYKILFIGNSLTSWNDGLDYHLEQLAGSGDPPLVIQADKVVKFGASLETLWKDTEAREMIGEGSYDVVILQGKLPQTDLEAFHAYTSLFVAEIRETRANPVLFMSWSRRGITPEEIAQAYGSIAAELSVDVAPAGLAWKHAMEERPDLDLYSSDKTHPSIHGSYLVVNVLYGTIFGESPIGLSYLPSMSPGVTEDEAAFLQRVAWETVQEYQGNSDQ